MVQGEQQEKLIGIIDYGMGNLRSVYNAFRSLDANAVLVNEASQFNGLSHLVLPGVGSFAKAMENLEQLGLVEPIREFANSGKPMLGICLGMQLMATKGYEPYEKNGLGLIDGEVIRMDFVGVRIPHVGWNALELTTDHSLFQGMRKQVDFYFVHSYFFSANKEENILAYTNYGKRFPSVVYQGNITGVQFHPEKSQKHGLRILESFYNN
jgi:imidazole glycerol-phosphate synthase subunit HisH